MKKQSVDLTSEKISVMQLITGLGVGGAERVVMGLVESLPEQSIRSVAVAMKHDRDLLTQYAHTAFPIYSLGMARNPWSFIRAAVILTRIIRRERISLIHAHMFHALCLALVCKIATPHCKVVFTSHNSEGFPLLRRILIRASKPLRAADVIFTKEQHPALNSKYTVVIPNGVPVKSGISANLRAAKERRVFLSVGRLEPVKNPIGIIRSFAAMRRSDCELWFAGDGSLRPELEIEIAVANLGGRARLLGVRQDLPQLMEQADCLVMASLWEGMPMAILEAGAAALPVIAPPVGAIPAVLGDGRGYLTSITGLSDTLDAVLDDYEEAERRGKRLHDKVLNEYSLERMTRAHTELYISLLSDNQS